MEDPKKTRSQELTMITFKSISLYASRANLWQRSPTGKSLEVDARSMIPVVKITQNFKQSLLRAVKDSSFLVDIERFVKATVERGECREILLQEVQFFTRTHEGEMLLKLVSAKTLERKEYDDALNSISRKIENYEEFEQLDVKDLCVPIVQYFEYQQCVKLLLHLVFPSVNLIFQPISQLKIVSTPLSVSLIKREQQGGRFLTGYLTLDQKKRVLPLKVSDKSLLKYPLVGVWATGPALQVHQNPLIWAACIRFIESQLIHERISPNPSTNTFLFTIFSPKPSFFEVSTNGKSTWKNAVRVVQAGSSEVRFSVAESVVNPRGMRDKKSMTASTSSSEGRYSRTRASFESDVTEQMILKQNLMLRSLEKQINDLQHALSEPSLVNAETNTTSYFANSKGGANRFTSRRQSATNAESVEFAVKSNPLRSSCNADFQCLRSDTTILVPKIVYKPDSESDEEGQNEFNYFA